MRALGIALVATACGSHDGGAPTPSAAPKPAAPPDVTVTAQAIVAGTLKVPVADDAMGQYRALREALGGQLRGASHPVVAIAAGAHGDAALVTIAALEDTGAEHVEVRAADGHRVCDLARPPKPKREPVPVDLTGSGGADTPPRPAMLSVLVTSDTTFVAQVGGDIESLARGAVAAAVAKIGAAAAYQGRTDAELSSMPDVPATDVLEVMGAMCGRFPALAMLPPAGLTTAPSM
jgi:hypothetical protein